MIASPPRGWWRVVALTSEWDGSRWVPTVRHEMYGPTKEDAIAVYQAHMQTDAFLRGCSLSGRFDGITCQTETEVGPI